MTRPEFRQPHGLEKIIIDGRGQDYWDANKAEITRRMGQESPHPDGNAWERRRASRLEKQLDWERRQMALLVPVLSAQLTADINICLYSLKGEGFTWQYIAQQMGFKSRSSLYHYRRGEVKDVDRIHDVLDRCRRLI